VVTGTPGRDAPADARAHDVPDLVRAAQRGDRDAFGVLYTRFAAYVHGLLLAYVLPEDAADLVHDVFLRALDKLASLSDPAAFGGWIGQIARNMAKMNLRSRIELVPLDDQLAAPSKPAPDADGAAVLDTIRSLPETYREPLLLRLVEGMSGDEIAERTGLTPGSVRVNLHRGMALLKHKLGERGRTP
jgi:RNA polymerase sigma-70 factor (ECF subfamily)